MSLLRRRALMGKKAGGAKPNVFTVTESTREFNTPDGRQRANSGIAGVLKKGTEYHITGTVIINVINTVSSVRVRVAKWNTFSAFDKEEIPVGIHEFKIDTVATSGSDQNGDGIFELDCYNLAGTVSLKNMSAVEV